MKPLQSRQSLGKKGEQIAAEYLLRHGYSIIERNFRIRYGEVDIVACDNDTIVFVEVKTRTTNQFGTPEDAITAKKLRDMTKAAEVYVSLKYTTEPLMRLDVVGILVDSSGTPLSIEHTRDVG